VLNVEEGEATCLLYAWVKDLHINNVTFELDSKRVVDRHHNNKIYEADF